MVESGHPRHLVAVIGAGPAGLYASQYLARQGMKVVLFNRDIKPGGLAEYGIFPDKHKMRLGLKAQFKRILSMPGVTYQGNVSIGRAGDIKLDDLRGMGFQAIMVTTGAQENNWLGIPGEDLEGVYQANDVVFHYNQLPERNLAEIKIGSQVAIIGVGNVMLDIVHYLRYEKSVQTVTAFARRGPTQVKFDKLTLAPVADCLDLPAIEQEVNQAACEVENAGGDIGEFYALLEEAHNRAERCDSGLKFGMQFLRSPRRLMGDAGGRVRAIVFERNRLVRNGEVISARGTGELETVPVDTVIFSIGSRVDEGFGLPVGHGTYVTNPEPRFPVDEISYEVYNPELCAQCEDIFVSGWARLASEGVVGLARKDAERGARAVLQYLQTLKSSTGVDMEAVLSLIGSAKRKVVNFEGLRKLWDAEARIAADLGLEEYKFASNEAMLRVIEEN